MSGNYVTSGVGAEARRCFPIFERTPNLHYLDSAASALKPKVVIDRISSYYSYEHANIHRGAYQLSANATKLYDESREVVAKFIGAKPHEVVFTSGCTEGINLVATALHRKIGQGDVILLSVLEHHSNIVPWQINAARTSSRVEFINITPNAALDYEDAERKILSLKPKIVSITALSNAFGTYTDIARVVSLAKKVGAMVFVDAAQLVAHERIDVKKLEIDFLAFSAHKLYGPTGVGALYINEKVAAQLEPYQGGGDMIFEVTTSGSTWAEPPSKFEAGTPPIAQAIGMAEAVKFFGALNTKEVRDYEHSIASYGCELLKREPGVSLYGAAAADVATPIVAFNVSGIHPHDLSTICDEVGVQIRAGTHCAMPALKVIGQQSTARASTGIYSVKDDFDALLEGVRRAKKLFK